MRGSTEGGLWGLALGALGLSFASLAADPPAGLRTAQGPQADTAVAADVAGEVQPASNDMVVASTDTAVVSRVAPQELQQPTAETTFENILNGRPPVIMADVVLLPTSVVVGSVPVVPDTMQPRVAFFMPDPLPQPDIDRAPVIDTAPATPPAQDTEVAQNSSQTVQRSFTRPAPQVIVPESREVNIIQTQSQVPAGNDAVRINRLTTENAAPITQEPEEDAAEEPSVDLSALAAHSAIFENPDALPVISIVLVDDGAITDGAGAIAELGFAPTVVINALEPDAAERMAAYRAVGAEVAMQIQLPDGAQPADVEVAFAAAFRLMPEAAMLYSDGTGVLQNDRSVTGQVMKVLMADGHGFVTIQQGLGNAVRAAAQEGVPATTVTRAIDENSDSIGAITRALDQAAFRARQTGGAVLLGRLQNSTVQALRDWAASAVEDGVAPAPVSAVLLEEDA